MMVAKRVLRTTTRTTKKAARPLPQTAGKCGGRSSREWSACGNLCSRWLPDSGYNPGDYAHLDVSAEIRELFGYIGRYKPHNIELDTKIKCFIPDYIPAVGEIDAFIKVARPDGKADDLGLKVLDEPAARQSDPTRTSFRRACGGGALEYSHPTDARRSMDNVSCFWSPVLDMIWRELIKKPVAEPVRVASIENADKNPKEIQKWIASIHDLHRTQPRPHVQYKKSMPDIEMLMQEWPPEFEKRLKQVRGCCRCAMCVSVVVTPSFLLCCCFCTPGKDPNSRYQYASQRVRRSHMCHHGHPCV